MRAHVQLSASPSRETSLTSMHSTVGWLTKGSFRIERLLAVTRVNSGKHLPATLWRIGRARGSAKGGGKQFLASLRGG